MASGHHRRAENRHLSIHARPRPVTLRLATTGVLAAPSRLAESASAAPAAQCDLPVIAVSFLIITLVHDL
jgi:hypothetical protein